MKTKPQQHDKFTVGTLSYDKKGLWQVFFWLMWNDFSIMLLEQVTSLTGILMRDRGASYTLMATFGTVGGVMGMWINPFFSTWSDRLRTRFGRRRPFLLIATPLFAVSLCAIAFMPDLYHFLMRSERIAAILNHLPGNGEVWFIGVASIINGMFNGVGGTVATVFGLALGYSAGSMIDRLKPIRVIPVTFFIWSGLTLISYFYVHDKMSAAIMVSLINVNMFVFSVALAAVTIELFPREKLGQFCSAQAFFYQTIIMVLNPCVISPFFDWLKFNRAGYLWSTVFYFLAGLVTVKVYLNWKQKQVANDRIKQDAPVDALA